MLGERITQRLDALGMSQKDLASKANVSQGYVSDLINGRRGRRLGYDVTQRLARALKVRPIFFSAEFAYANNAQANPRIREHDQEQVCP